MENEHKPEDINIVKGSDFATSTQKETLRPLSDTDNEKKRKEDEFSELEKSRMESPPDERETNGSEENVEDRVNDSDQSKGVA